MTYCSHKSLIYLALGFLLTVLALWIFYMGYITVWLGDDLDYMFMVHDSIWDSSGSIDTLGELFTSMYFHYIYVNGRYVAHFLVQLFCGMLSQPVFAVANALVWVLFVVLIIKTAGGRVKDIKTTATVVVLALISFITKMMPTCQIGFIWMFTLVMAWIVLYRHLSERKIAWWWMPLLWFFSVLAGNAQEAINVGVAVALFCEACRVRFRFTPVQWVMLTGFAVGCAFLCFTPAMFGRVDTIRLTWFQSLCNTLLSLRIFYVMLVVVAVALLRRRTTLREVWLRNRFWLIAMVALFAMNFVIKVYCNRQLMGVELCSLIVTLRTLRGYALPWGWIAALGVVTVWLMYTQWCWVEDSRRQYQEIVDLYVESKNGAIYVDRYRSSGSPQALLARYNENVIGPHNGDLRHSMGKYFRVKYPSKEKKWLTIYPAALRDKENPLHRGEVREYYPGHFVIMADTMAGHRLVVHHEANLPGVHVKMKTDTVDYMYNYTKQNSFATYLIIPEDPMRRVVDVEIL